MQELRFDDGIRFTAVVSSDQTGLRRALGAHELLASVYASPRWRSATRRIVGPGRWATGRPVPRRPGVPGRLQPPSTRRQQEYAPA